MTHCVLMGPALLVSTLDAPTGFRIIMHSTRPFSTNPLTCACAWFQINFSNVCSLSNDRVNARVAALYVSDAQPQRRAHLAAPGGRHCPGGGLHRAAIRVRAAGYGPSGPFDPLFISPRVLVHWSIHQSTRFGPLVHSFDPAFKPPPSLVRILIPHHPMSDGIHPA